MVTELELKSTNPIFRFLFGGYIVYEEEVDSSHFLAVPDRIQ